MEFFGRFKAASCNGSDSVVADQDHFRLPDAAGPTSAAKAARSTPARAARYERSDAHWRPAGLPQRMVELRDLLGSEQVRNDDRRLYGMALDPASWGES